MKMELLRLVATKASKEIPPGEEYEYLKDKDTYFWDIDRKEDGKWVSGGFHMWAIDYETAIKWVEDHAMNVVWNDHKDDILVPLEDRNGD